MGLRTKFNLAFVLVFVLGVMGTGYVARRLLRQNALEEVMRNASIMMAASLAARDYTVHQIKPHLSKLIAKEFLPQTVPSYSATEIFALLRELSSADYTYKEATLNPTNPRDRAADWEADVINFFRDNKEMAEHSGVRSTPMGDSLFLARPLRVGSQECLDCHGVPEKAPKSMLQLYGTAHGFGWQLNETIGAQIVSVPMQVAVSRSDKAFSTFMVSLVAVFGFVFVVLNVLLTFLVLRPISWLAERADAMSAAAVELEEIPVKGADEISKLTHSFNRMVRSLKKAMGMLE